MPTQDISPIDTIVELTALLADRYRVERELGRGGMATVYLAHDLKHDRPVALKVMHLEIAAGLGVERFLREVRLTARLQHPHILPVFDSGTVAGRPWYSMPYVPGESLRDRLRREVQLPVDTAVEIARQVALALDAAHRQGAVHRDVKPENILLSDGQALIADFGIARAIDSAGEERITSSGLAVGTPAYMAPEQAGGGPIDGRADVYALGCVLYEMLAGEPPVTGATPQAIIAKRLAHPSPSVLVVRPSVPKPVDAAVRKALAPVPADRFAGAAQLAEALVLKPARAGARSAVWGMLGLGVLILIAGAYLLYRGRPPSPPTLLSAGVLRTRDPLLIADFESPAGDSVLGPVVTEAFRIDLTGSPVVTVMTAPMVDSALMRMRRPVSERIDAALAREIALREGVKAVVTGQVARVTGSYLVSAEVIAAASGEVLAAHRETAADSTRLIEAIDRLSGRLRERIGESLRSVREEPPLQRVTTGSLEALWKYTKAAQAGDGESDYVRAVALLQEAVALDTGFATAYRTLGTYQGFLGDREGEVAALTRAVRHSDRLTESEREHTRALYHALVTGRLDQTVAAYRALLERRPEDSMARNNLGAFYNSLHQPARAESILRPGLDTVRPWMPGFHVNLAYALVALGRRAEAERIFEQGARLFPGNRAFAWYRVRLATSRGDYPAAASHARAFLDRYGETPAERITPLRELAGIALVRGRLTEAEQRLGEAMAAAAQVTSYAAYLEAAAALGYLHVWFRRDPARGLETVAAALARYPLDSIAVLERPYLTLAFLYASAGQPQRARALLGMYERGVDPELRRIHEPRLRWTWGQVALAERRFADAIREFRAYLPAPRDCLPCGHAALARAYDGAGNADSALALYQRYLAIASADRLNESHLFEDDATQLAPACKRLGELYEQRGEWDKATEYYRRFVALWQEADPELRPAVGEIRQRLRQ